jgi:hypothetical protein
MMASSVQKPCKGKLLYSYIQLVMLDGPYYLFICVMAQDVSYKDSNISKQMSDNYALKHIKRCNL